MVQMTKVNGVRWYGHVLRRDDGHLLRKALEFEGQEEARTTKEDVEDTSEESKSVVSKKEDALNRARWRVGVREIAVRVR